MISRERAAGIIVFSLGVGVFGLGMKNLVEAQADYNGNPEVYTFRNDYVRQVNRFMDQGRPDLIIDLTQQNSDNPIWQVVKEQADERSAREEHYAGRVPSLAGTIVGGAVLAVIGELWTMGPDILRKQQQDLQRKYTTLTGFLRRKRDELIA